VTADAEAETVACRLIDAFDAIDFDAMRLLLADDLLVMAMVEVRAVRGARTLHNHATHRAGLAQELGRRTVCLTEAQ
jgi:hypothetical protein